MFRDNAGRTYSTFISYASADARWASRIAREIESYRVPAAVAAMQTGVDVRSRRIGPVFRDTDELKASADLRQSLHDALDAARTLTVVCSSRTDGSRWVAEEITYFRSIDRGKQIFCVAVPDDVTLNAVPATDLVPKALLGDQNSEPFVIDRRVGWREQRRRRVQLIAAILGVNFDDLWQRDLQRTRRRQATIAASAAAATLALTLVLGMSWSAIEREYAEKLVNVAELQQGAGNPAISARLARLAYLRATTGSMRARAQQIMLQAVHSSPMVLSVQGPRVTAAAFAPDGQYLSYVLDNQELVVLRLRDGGALTRTRASEWLSKLVFSADGRSIRGHNEGSVIEFMLPTGDPPADAISAPRRSVGRRDAIPAAATEKGFVWFDDRGVHVERADEPPRRFEMPSQAPHTREKPLVEVDVSLQFVSLSWGPDRTEIIRVSDGSVFRYNYPVALSRDGGRTLHALYGRPIELGGAPGEPWRAALPGFGGDQRVLQYIVDDGVVDNRSLHRLDFDSAFSPDGRWLLSLDATGIVHRWNSSTGLYMGPLQIGFPIKVSVLSRLRLRRLVGDGRIG